jgi:hypothetical protein
MDERLAAGAQPAGHLLKRRTVVAHVFEHLNRYDTVKFPP